MRKVIVSAFTSLDGVMQAPGGPNEDPVGGFRYGGWIVPYADQTMSEAIGELFARPFDLLLGRKTYDIFAAYWPYVDPDHPIGRPFNRTMKYVASRNPNLKLDWQNSHALGADAVAAVRKLKSGTGPDLLTQGSADFLKTLFAQDLVDEINMMVFPLVLGKGKRLFGDGALPTALKLVSSKVSGTGVIISRYASAGEIVTGSFGSEQPSEAELARRRTLT